MRPLFQDCVDTECMFCGSTYFMSNSKETWLQYSQCIEWAHDDCTGHDGDADYISVIDAMLTFIG